MLKKLTEAFGVSGNEGAVRDIITQEMSKYCENRGTDAMGNSVFFKKGTKGYHNKIMLTAHMDEVGFIISAVTEEGDLKFRPVGGIDTRIIQNSYVLVGDGAVPGVIGVKPAHMAKEYTPVTTKDLVIDIGCCSAKEALELVSIGDYVSFDSKYIEFGNGLIKAKALDDRVGCYTLLRLAERDYPNDIYFTFSVQEEVGCRGAAVLANRIKPDFAFVIEGTTCSDVPFCDEYHYSTRLGKGAALSMLDGGSYIDKAMTKLMHDNAAAAGIPVQYKKVTFGGNDAASIQVSGAGVRTAAISVPCRYIHSPVSVASKSDINSCFDILNKTLSEENELWSF